MGGGRREEGGRRYLSLYKVNTVTVVTFHI
jgi:hypothetical protein